MPLPIETEKSRHPFEIFILSVSLLAGTNILLGGQAPPPIAAMSSDDGRLLWSALLTLGSLIALIGAYWHNRVLSLLLTQIGMSAIASSAFWFSVATLLHFGIGGIITALIVMWFGVSAVRRWLEIQSEIDAAAKAGRNS